MFDEYQELIGVDDVARSIGCHKSLVYTLVREKQIGHIRIGKYIRFKPSDVKNFIESRQVNPDKSN